MPKLRKYARSPKRATKNSSSTQSVLRRIWQHLSPLRRWQLLWLAVLMLLSGVADAMSLGAVLPFLAVMVNPDEVFEQPWIAQFVTALGMTTSEQLILPLAVGFAVAALAAGAMRLLVLWANKDYVQWVSHELTVALYDRMLYQPYRVHVAYNTSEIISAVSKITVVTAALNYGLTMVSAGFTAMAIMLTLMVLQPAIAFFAFVGVGGLYGLVIFVTRQRLVHNSRLISRNSVLRLKALQEGLGGIRDVLLSNNQPFYSDLYRRADWPYSRAKAENIFIAISPRYVMESLGMVLIAGMAYGLSQRTGDEALPVLGTFALGAQRLLPAFQQIFSSWTSLRGDQSSAEDVLKLLDQPMPSDYLQPLPPALVWRSTVEFSRVSFRYTDLGAWVLQDVSFKIEKGARVGFVGTTGSGKSTTLDILMALLEPTEGEVLVDGVPIHGTYSRAWQQAIAHVPQHIYLADTSIAENIALGVPKAEINLDRVKLAAQQAQIAEFIEHGQAGYWAKLGERGIRLSGGQRQRIGIARALYKQASVLVFDEATSALDNATEQEVMAAINGLSDDLTILLIAHRLSTVQNCNWIVELSQGRVVAQGRYQELMHKSKSFQRMAGMT